MARVGTHTIISLSVLCKRMPPAQAGDPAPGELGRASLPISNRNRPKDACQGGDYPSREKKK